MGTGPGGRLGGRKGRWREQIPRVKPLSLKRKIMCVGASLICVLLGGCIDVTPSSAGRASSTTPSSLAWPWHRELVGGAHPPHSPDPLPASAPPPPADCPAGSVRQTTARGDPVVPASVQRIFPTLFRTHSPASCTQPAHKYILPCWLSETWGI